MRPIAVLVGGPDREEARREQERLQNLANALAEEKARSKVPWVGVLCGPGNNGGDGVAAARILMGMGCRVRAFLVGDRSKMTPDERAMEEKLKEAGGALEAYLPLDREQSFWLAQCDCLVDALFGVGLSRPVEGDFLYAVREMQDRPHFRRVVSCDIPSGVHADTGEVLGEAVHAGVTVTFTCAKPGHYLGDGAEYTGKLRIRDIGIPDELLFGPEARERFPVEAVEGTFTIPRRKPNSHKGDYGRLFLLAGSEGYTGAPVLAASAAVRSGAGLVFLGVPREIYPIVAVKCSSAMPFPLPERYEEILEKARSCDAALIGPGLGRAPKTEKLVRALLEDLEIPVVLDGRAEGPHRAHPPRRGVCPAHRDRPAHPRPPGGGPVLCQGPQLHSGAQGPPDHHRRPGRPGLDQHQRQPGYGQGGQRGRLGGPHHLLLESEAVGVWISGGPNRRGGVPPRFRRGQGGPKIWGIRHDAGGFDRLYPRGVEGTGAIGGRPVCRPYGGDQTGSVGSSNPGAVRKPQ